MDSRTAERRLFPSTRTTTAGENPMNLTRHAITVGLAALSLTAGASPALAKGGGDGGGDINNTVIQISPLAPAPLTTSGSGGSGGGGRALRCAPTGGIDPVTGSTIMVCTSARV
jgi:hypothetical protein